MEHEKNTPLSLPHFKKTFMSYMGWPPKYVYNLDGILGNKSSLAYKSQTAEEHYKKKRQRNWLYFIQRFNSSI